MRVPHPAVIFYTDDNYKEQSEVFVAIEDTVNEAIDYLNQAHERTPDEPYRHAQIEGVYPVTSINDSEGNEYLITLWKKVE